MEGAGNSSELLDDCYYMGTDHLAVKIWLVGVVAVSVCALSACFNSFFAIVFFMNPELRRTAVFYFGVIALIDILMAVNYVALIAIPVYMDFYSWEWIYEPFVHSVNVLLTETNTAMFASMLLILAATTERLLRTFHSPNVIGVRKNLLDDHFIGLSIFLNQTRRPGYLKKIRRVRKFLEKNRPVVCVCCVLSAILYKATSVFEVTFVEKENCQGFAHYEIVPGWLALIPWYQWWWMFVTRNVIDRISPFFILVAMNFLIIRALKKEYHKQVTQPKMSMTDSEWRNSQQSRSSLRDATRALISLVSLYLMSQSLQVMVTFWEAIDRVSLETNHALLYSYLNDVISILPLIASCVRFPVYCSCNQHIYNASRQTLSTISGSFKFPPIPLKYLRMSKSSPPIAAGKASDPLCPSSTEEAVVDVSEDSEQEWQL